MVMMIVCRTIDQPQLWMYWFVHRSHTNSGRAMGPNQPKLIIERRSLAAPLMVGTETDSSTASPFGSANSRSVVLPGWPTATPGTSTGLVSLGLLESVTMSTGLFRVTATTLSAESGMKTAPKYWLLTPIQL